MRYWEIVNEDLTDSQRKSWNDSLSKIKDWDNRKESLPKKYRDFLLNELPEDIGMEHALAIFQMNGNDVEKAISWLKEAIRRYTIGTYGKDYPMTESTKKSFKNYLAGLLLAGGLAFGASGDATAQTTTFRVGEEITTSSKTTLINLRKGPGTNFSVIDKIHSGNNYTIDKIVGDWALVEVEPGKEGWIHFDFVAKQGEYNVRHTTPSAKPVNLKPGNAKLSFASGLLNVRNGPGPSNGIKYQLESKNNGATVEIDEIEGEWALITFKTGTKFYNKDETGTGWVKIDFLKQ